MQDDSPLEDAPRPRPRPARPASQSTTATLPDRHPRQLGGDVHGPDDARASVAAGTETRQIRALLTQLRAQASRDLTAQAMLGQAELSAARLASCLGGPEISEAHLRSVTRTLSIAAPRLEPQEQAGSGVTPKTGASVSADQLLIALHKGLIGALRPQDGPLNARFSPWFEEHLHALARTRPGTAPLEIATELRIAQDDQQPATMARHWSWQWQALAAKTDDLFAIGRASTDLLTRLHGRADGMQARAWVGLWVDLAEASVRWDPHVRAYANPLNFSTFLQIAIDGAERRQARGGDTKEWLAASGSELALRLGPREPLRRQFELAVAHCKRDLDERHHASINALASGFRAAATVPPAQPSPPQPGGSRSTAMPGADGATTNPH
ncbi:hypothetical protein JI739_05065 [Ramlibacter sp. AW1]|uniref:Uncharacterized protein n=1 Tax=Ramlibacter aurantiacus TaxID=2801330 RepID=A0A936ZRH8_9BURK|nr:hypothetical protein [Ramlibacter aurantiacus]MBL0419715.1 hypothetical protein [Ramlibacter aurantiacus]